MKLGLKAFMEKSLELGTFGRFWTFKYKERPLQKKKTLNKIIKILVVLRYLANNLA